VLAVYSKTAVFKSFLVWLEQLFPRTTLNKIRVNSFICSFLLFFIGQMKFAYIHWCLRPNYPLCSFHPIYFLR